MNRILGQADKPYIQACDNDEYQQYTKNWERTTPKDCNYILATGDGQFISQSLQDQFLLDRVTKYRRVFLSSTKITVQDARKWQPFLGCRPLEVIRHTLNNTTQLAMTSQVSGMRRHVQSRYPFLNRKRLNETVATDTFSPTHGILEDTHVHRFSMV